ncbi:Uracil-DNA glycosylase [Aedoeadaptatus ivorii]|uniref:Uracil-DNA glycosylase n=1 Tax=Aedoeadaptatus ivorii TaxID=54006 RepID=A0A448V047_9FIRM|nr:uracil-DNA glycosylase [Peptoniphilus ivorii]VEJ34771.1 Uracil-DNA glycosylase [Peptoniphilus ivorii]
MIFGNDWDIYLKDEMEKPYYRDLRRLLAEEYRNFTVYPPAKDVFRAMKLTPFADTKVVLLGQDPYHGPGQAQGLSFSVDRNMPLPPSLKNIYKELEDDTGICRKEGDLTDWAKQGVLLLNTTLTVRHKQPMSHAKIGWELFTDRVIRLVGEKEDPVVFLLWGGHARSKKKLIERKNHLVIESPHPSPLSAYRGFFGSRCFSRTNDFLTAEGEEPIDWSEHVL